VLRNPGLEGEVRLTEREFCVYSAIRGEFTAAELYMALVAESPAPPFDEFLGVLALLADHELIQPAKGEPLAPERRLLDPVFSLLRVPVVYLPLFVLGVALLAHTLLQANVLLHRLRDPPAEAQPLVWALVSALVYPYARQIFRLRMARRRPTPGTIAVRQRGWIPTIRARLAYLGARRAGEVGVVLSSGFFFDVWTLVALSLAARVPNPVWRAATTAQIVIVAAVAVVSLNPLADYDAHQIFCVLTGLSNVRREGLKALGRAVRGARDRTTLLLACYGALCVGYLVAVVFAFYKAGAWFLSATFYVPAPTGRALSMAAVATTLLVMGLVRFARRGRQQGASILAPRGSIEGAVPAVLVDGAAIERDDAKARSVYGRRIVLLRQDDCRAFDAAWVDPSLQVLAVPAAPPGRLDPSDPSALLVERLSGQMFRRPASALNVEERRRVACALTLAEHGRSPDRYVFVPGAHLVAGRTVRGFLDFLPRGETFTFDAFAKRFYQLRAPDIATTRDSFDLALVSRSTGRFEVLALKHAGDDDPSRRRAAEVLRAVRGIHETTPKADGVAALLADLQAGTSAAERAFLTAWRGFDDAFAAENRIISFARERSPEELSPAAREAAKAMGFVEVVTRAGATEERFAVTGPCLIVPLGTTERPVGVKLRYVSPRLTFRNQATHSANWRRFTDFMLPPRSVAGDPGDTLDQLPGWRSAMSASSLAVFEGELKAMTYSKLFGESALGLGGLEYNILQCFAAGLSKVGLPRRVLLCFDGDAPARSAARSDKLTDAQLRGLQVESLLRALDPSIEVTWVPGLTHDGEKVDLDQLLGFRRQERDALTRRFEENVASAARVRDLLIGDWTAYVESSVAFAEDCYAALRERWNVVASPDPPGRDGEWSQCLSPLFSRGIALRRRGTELANLSPASALLGGEGPRGAR
jgi:hypothetical protein